MLIGNKLELVAISYGCYADLDIPYETLPNTSLFLFRTNYYILDEDIKKDPKLKEDVKKSYPMSSWTKEQKDDFDHRFPDRDGFSKSMPILIFARPICYGKYESFYKNRDIEASNIQNKKLIPHPSIRKDRWFYDEIVVWVAENNKYFLTHGTLGFRLWKVIDITPALRSVDSKTIIENIKY